MENQIDQEYLIEKSQSEDLEDLIGRLLFRLLKMQGSVDARMGELSESANAHQKEVIRYEHSSALHSKIVEELTKKLIKTLENKEIDLTDVIAGLDELVLSIDSGNESVIEKLEELVKQSPDVLKSLEKLTQVVKDSRPKELVLDELIESQEAGFGVLGKLLVSLTEEVKKEKIQKVTISEPLEIKEPKWWKGFSFSWDPLEKMLEKFFKKTLTVKQAEPFEVTIKGLPKEIADALGQEIMRVMPRAMPGAGYNNPFSFDAQGNLKVSGGASGEGGDASEATLQAILLALDTVETKLQAISDNTDTLEANTDGMEALLTQISGFVDTLETNTDGLETLTTAIRDYLDTVETKLQSLIDKPLGTAILKKTVALTSSGVVHDPAAGKKIRLYSIKFSLSADMTDVAFNFGAEADFEKYLSPKAGGLYGGNTHPDYIEGAIDENLDCVITGTGTVQVIIEYLEI